MERPRPRLGLTIPNFADPATLVELGVRAEASGWDGVFLWDHTHGSPAMPVPTAAPWVVLGAMAIRTERIRLGTAVTAVARRRPHELARETVTVDHLSGGRLVLGVGLGEPPEEHTAYGDPADRRTLAEKLDEGLEVLAGLWSGEPFTHRGRHFTVEDAQYLPVPVQRPRIPVWAACNLPHTRPLRRAARWDGVVLANLGPEGSIDPVPVDAVRGALAIVAEHRPPDAAPLDVAVGHPGLPDDGDLDAYAAAGVTWVLATGWLEDLDRLVDLATSPPR